MIKIFFALSLALLMSGCVTIQPVKPWQKRVLAKDSMTQSGGNTLFEKFQKHIYFSKEASKGGGGVAGGGCGCN